jgi:nucleotide-binding universal stress UspA family protein
VNTESGAATEAVDDVVAMAEEAGVAETVSHVERGSPADVIRDVIDDADVAVVGMGTVGRRGTDRILLGSVAEKTVRTAPVPVLTVAQPD